MGDPCTPTPADRDATLELARAMVDTNRCDEAWPAPFTAMGRSPSAPDTVAVFRLCQDLAALADELRRFRVAMARASAFRGLVLRCVHARCLASIDLVIFEATDSAWSINERGLWLCPSHIDAAEVAR